VAFSRVIDMSSIPPAPVAAQPSHVPARTARLRSAAQRVAAAQAEQLRWTADLLRECLADVPRFDGDWSTHDVQRYAHCLAEGELSCALGIGAVAASRLLDLAWWLVSVLPEVLTALGDGALDLPRVRVLSELTEVLDDDTARRVAGQLVADAGPSPWEGPSPRAWRARVERAVIRADVQAAARRRARAVAARRVQTWAERDGVGVLQLRGDVADIAMADQVVGDLARAWPEVDHDGVALTMDQRRADALIDLLRRVGQAGVDRDPDGDDATAGDLLPTVTTRRVHDLGVVLHVDTLFDDGPAASDCGQLRGLGAPTALDPVSARGLARRQLARGTVVQALVVDASGALQQVVRLGRSPRAGWSRDGLLAAVREALPRQSGLSTSRYEPTAAIARYVRAEAPTCSFYDCARVAVSCDIDHDTPWPRGPTDVTNLDPKCRRHHDPKTRGLVRTRLRAGPGRGTRGVTWTLRSGLVVTTRPAVLPGCAEPLVCERLPAA
jgi:hypothetical protein